MSVEPEGQRSRRARRRPRRRTSSVGRRLGRTCPAQRSIRSPSSGASVPIHRPSAATASKRAMNASASSAHWSRLDSRSRSGSRHVTSKHHSTVSGARCCDVVHPPGDDLGAVASGRQLLDDLSVPGWNSTTFWPGSRDELVLGDRPCRSPSAARPPGGEIGRRSGSAAAPRCPARGRGTRPRRGARSSGCRARRCRPGWAAMTSPPMQASTTSAISHPPDDVGAGEAIPVGISVPGPADGLDRTHWYDGPTGRLGTHGLRAGCTVAHLIRERPRWVGYPRMPWS